MGDARPDQMLPLISSISSVTRRDWCSVLTSEAKGLAGVAQMRLFTV